MNSFRTSLARYGVAAIAAGLMPLSAFALPEISDDEGWAGEIGVGAGYLNLDSNTIAGTKLIGLENDRLSENDLSNEASSRSSFIPAVIGEVRWTLGRNNQLFFGTSTERAVSLDGGLAFGWRKGTDNAGTFEVAALTGGIAPLRVYADPFLTDGSKRDKTDSDRTGLRLTWDRIMNTGFEAQLQFRSIDVDKDRNGQSLVGTNPLGGNDPLTNADLKLLERDADETAIKLAYRFDLGDGHSLRPLIAYRDRDADGDAEDFDATRFQLTYAYQGDKTTFVTNASFGSRDFDKDNPIYGQDRDSDTLAFDATVFYDLPYDNWRIFGNALWAEDDSDIDFYTTEMTRISAGAQYKF
jgi:hypothetical protein